MRDLIKNDLIYALNQIRTNMFNWLLFSAVCVTLVYFYATTNKSSVTSKSSNYTSKDFGGDGMDHETSTSKTQYSYSPSLILIPMVWWGIWYLLDFWAPMVYVTYTFFGFVYLAA